MLGDFSQHVRALGWTSGSDILYAEGMIAAGVVVLALTFGWILSRVFGPRLASVWEARAGYESEIARHRIRDMVRRLSTALVVLLALSLFDWTEIAEVVFGITLAITIGLFVNDLVRGIRLPDWLGSVLGVGTFIAILAIKFDGLEPITSAMDRVGFDIGDRRFSLLWLVTIVTTAVLLLIAVRIVSRLASHSINSSSKMDAAQKLLGQKIASVVILIGAFFIGLDLLGIDLTALSFFSGAFGLAVGFGLQKTIGNLFAGIILLMDRSIKPGDIIVVGDSFGWVNKIGVRAVSVLTRDGKEHLIPNENLMTTEVENWSYSDQNVRMKIPVGVSYNSDMQLVQTLLFKAVEDSPRIMKRPEPKVWMLEFGDNSVNWEIRAWINDPQEGIGNIRGDIMMRIWQLFKENDIEIPFPQRDLHLKNWPQLEDVKATSTKEEKDDKDKS